MIDSLAFDRDAIPPPRSSTVKLAVLRSTKKPTSLADYLACNFDDGTFCKYTIFQSGKVNEHDKEYKFVVSKTNVTEIKLPKRDISGSGLIDFLKIIFFF